MDKRRKETIAYIVEMLSMFDGKTQTVKDTEEALLAMSEKDFVSYMEKLGKRQITLRYIKPNLTKSNISLETILRVGDKLGHDFFPRCWITDAKTGITHLTPKKYMVIMLPMRRQQQHLMKKISIADHHRNVDDTTGQVVGSDSKASSLSAPETEILRSHNLPNVIKEFAVVRGGDTKLYQRVSNHAFNTGVASVNAVDDGTTRVKSTISLSNYLKAAHHGNNL